jgi:hypothetical protein
MQSRKDSKLLFAASLKTFDENLPYKNYMKGNFELCITQERFLSLTQFLRLLE